MPRIVHHTDWILWLLLTSAALLLAARLYNPKRFRAYLQLPIHVKRTELQDAFSPAVGRGLFDISLAVLSYLMYSLALYLLIHPHRGSAPLLSDWVMYLRLLFLLPLFFLVKNFLGLFVGWVFSQSEEIGQAQNVNLAYRAWSAIFILPLCTLIVYFQPLYPVLYYVLSVLLILGYLVALQFSVRKLWGMMAPVYYKIFYLCALEITPLVFLVEWLKTLYQ
ncbi:MAG: DUF4271 domain-containing protein [Owenweeksia sp.]|nr:DUF4271 domain-containing protein [Owenweeksia sp.]